MPPPSTRSFPQHDMSHTARYRRPMLGLLLVALLQPFPSAEAKKPRLYPQTRRGNQIDEYHGTSVPDPYRWLEQDVRQSPEVAAWIDRQNQLTRRYLDSLAARPAIVERLTRLWDYPRFGLPQQAGGKYFYQKNDGLQNQPVLYITDSYDADGSVLLDPNLWSEDGTIAMARFVPSENGQLLAYQRSEAGSDWRTIRIMDVTTGTHLPEVLRWVRFSPLEWTRDGRGFFYNRYPEPEEGATHQSVALNQMVYFHQVGTPQEEDELIYRRPDHPEWHFAVEPTADGQYLVLHIEKSTDARNQLLFRPLEDQAQEWVPLIDDFQDQFYFIGNEGTRWYLFSDFAAPTRRVVSMDITRPGRERLTEVIPADEATLERVSMIDGRLIARYLRDVVTQVRVFELDGQLEREIPLPGVGSAHGFGGRPADRETFFLFTSFNRPASIYHYDMRSGAARVFRQPDVEFDPDSFLVQQVVVTSRDGTRIPMFLTHRRDLEPNGNLPTLLYGYGGFAIPISPAFRVTWLAWLEMGGLLAVPNLRGGGEYGEAWHQAGKVHRKQNVFDDFIAAAEWLLENNYTRPERLAVAGRSNGGLLVGAVMTQRPELFGACLPAVGVLDMLRFHRFTAGRFWVEEYGSADEPEQFAALHAYSPYHNVRPGTKYPATLVTTADTDDRVVPMHSFKFAAALQHAQAGEAPILIRIETRAGHGAGTPTTKRIEQAADLWAFLVENLDMKTEKETKKVSGTVLPE